MQQLHDEGPWDYEALVETVLKSDDALVITDPQGVLVLANSGASEVVGIPAESMVGHTVEDFGRESMHALQKVVVAAVAENGVEITVRDAHLRHSSGVLEHRGPDPDARPDRPRDDGRRSGSARPTSATGRPGSSAACSRRRRTAWSSSTATG